MDTCIFCSLIKPEQKLLQTENFFVVLDINPAQPGHLLIITKNHVMDIREFNDAQLLELIRLEQQLTNALYEALPVDGVTIAENNGHKIMQKGTHLHVHVIPRYEADGFWDNQNVAQHKPILDKLVQNLRG